MGVGAVGAGSMKQETKTYSDNLDKDAFLNLLVTQLRNQNPLEPMDNTEFISQMAQFSALEQAQNTNKTIKADSAYGMVGKLVKSTYVDDETDETKQIVGEVTMARIEGDNIYVKVGDTEVLYEDITEVTDLISPYEQMQTINQNFRMSSAFSLIGKDVKAKVAKDEDGKEFEEIAGKVTGVRMENGSIYAQIGEEEVLVETIYQVN
ncbi:MAG TPA: flagellar hook capping FlgD N-terminal domain-containing protein [Patescibacteria group bacterium]|nr:flagellar hook capping FlgD N-terminal domain-containing protein [Patescibacteria group bacterium]